ncbi:hypothetical protein EB001_13120 [bacterium]|nr:hypothetical protein [bacterium]
MKTTFESMSKEEADALRKEIAKKIIYQKQWVVPGKPKHIYHGSPNRITEFELRKHYLADDEAVIFGTPNRSLAITFLAYWRDYDFKQSVKDGVIYMEEQYPNALEKVYKGKVGFLYEFEPYTFNWEPQLMRSEYISRVLPRVLHIEQIDVYREILKEIGEGRIIVS